MNAAVITETVARKWPQSTTVCITGGEPTDHDLLPLIHALGTRFRIHLETSGKRAVHGYPLEWITVSPKHSSYVQRTGHALKVVVRPEWTWDHVNEFNNGTNFFHRYLQPLMTVSGETNAAQVIAMVAESGGMWSLSTQAHKTWGQP